ncbi:alpha/beta fold hydrolase [Nitrogeniibacter aestuarii]|uniref:alpha/beta fold hydrolase n=1 Tax=Nitrogeniibacter aestuarii TaxID=2815343 RepID=UPI001D12DD00|nr:alpha/beta fold hydrolase [Nitrogeniibacter aestuarii]
MKKAGKNRTNGRVELLAPNQRRWVRVTSSLLPGWTAERAERLLVRPPRARGRAAEVLDAWGEREDVELNGHAMALWHFGEAAGPRAVLVHGWGGYGGQFSTWIKPLLDAGLAVTVFDMPGHGESAGRAGRVDEFMTAISTVLTHVPNPVALAAHSMGGAASMQVLREHHELERVVVVAAPASLAHHMADLSRRVGLSPAAHENLVDRMESAHKPVAELDALSGLPLGRTRALFVHDRDDAEVSFALLARFGDLWPGSELMATEGYGHYKVLGAPEVVSRAVGFLAGA